MARLFDDYRISPAPAAVTRDDAYSLAQTDRARLLDGLQRVMRGALAERKRVAVVLLDLDGFGGMSDEWGQGAADRLLREVTWVLKSCLRSGDLACRYGLAEFVLMLPAVKDVDDVTTVVRKIRARLAESFAAECSTVPITVSVGLALHPGDGNNCLELLSHADFAMHLERTRGPRQAVTGLHS